MVVGSEAVVKTGNENGNENGDDVSDDVVGVSIFDVVSIEVSTVGSFEVVVGIGGKTVWAVELGISSDCSVVVGINVGCCSSVVDWDVVTYASCVIDIDDVDDDDDVVVVGPSQKGLVVSWVSKFVFWVVVVSGSSAAVVWISKSEVVVGIAAL